MRPANALDDTQYSDRAAPGGSAGGGDCFCGFRAPAGRLAGHRLFIAAALTDFFDGYIARKFDQISAFGQMLDPIADKAMVVIALAMVVGLYGPVPAILIPIALILLREVFVSGLREFLGADAAKLQVTWLAKWKTTAQMVAIPVLLLTNALSYEALQIYNQIGPNAGQAVLAGTMDDEFGFARYYRWSEISRQAGVALLWLASVLTVVTGVDYLRKAMPFLRDDVGK